MTKKSQTAIAIRHVAFEEALTDLGLSVNADEKVVIREFKKTVASGEKALKELRTNTRKLAQIASVLVEFFGNSQQEVADKIGFSQQWVSAVLKWKKLGFDGSPFVPLLSPPAPKVLPDPGKTPLRASDGTPLNMNNVSSKVKEQLEALTGEAVNDNEGTADTQPAGDEVADEQPAEDKTDDEAAKNAAKIADEAAAALRAEKDFAVTFFHSTPKTAIQRACYELLNRGAKPEDLFTAVAEVILPRVNSGTKAWIIKHAQAVRAMSVRRDASYVRACMARTWRVSQLARSGDFAAASRLPLQPRQRRPDQTG